MSDRKGNKNYINNGRRALRGESRDNDVNWLSITNEFDKGTGPEYSYFEGDHPTNCDVECFYLYDKAYGQFANSGDDKGGYSPGFNPLKTDNMQGQMMGTSNFSFYKVGDKTLSIVQDSKSRTSLFYHLPVKNYSRAEGMPQTPVGGSGVHNFSGYNGPMNFRNSKRTTNTYQTYLIFN